MGGKRGEREWSGLNRPLKVRSHQHCVDYLIERYLKLTYLNHCYVSGAERERSGRKSDEWEQSVEREQRAGVTKIGLSGERQIGRSHALHGTQPALVACVFLRFFFFFSSFYIYYF